MIQTKLVFPDSTTKLDSPLNMWQHKLQMEKLNKTFSIDSTQTLNVLLKTYTTKITLATQQNDNKDIWLSQFGHDKTQIALWWLAFNSYFYNCSRNSNTLTSHKNFIMMFQLSFGSSSSSQPSFNSKSLVNMTFQTWILSSQHNKNHQVT